MTGEQLLPLNFCRPVGKADKHIMVFVKLLNTTFKEVQIVFRLFLVNCYLLHVSSLPSQPASNVGGLVIH